MAMSEKLKRAIEIALCDSPDSFNEFIALFGAAVGSVVAAGEFTTAGGDTTETIPVAGLLATDSVTVVVKTAGAAPVTIEDQSASAGQIDLTMSADPSTDHVLSYQVLRTA